LGLGWVGSGMLWLKTRFAEWSTQTGELNTLKLYVAQLNSTYSSQTKTKNKTLLQPFISFHLD
jgi:hypothetical protein